MLEQSTQALAPAMIEENLVSYEEQQYYASIFKGMAHALFIPLALSVWSPGVAAGYLVCATLLYSTVFRHKSDGFFGTIVFIIVMAAMMIVPS